MKNLSKDPIVKKINRAISQGYGAVKHPNEEVLLAALKEARDQTDKYLNKKPRDVSTLISLIENEKNRAVELQMFMRKQLRRRQNKTCTKERSHQNRRRDKSRNKSHDQQRVAYSLAEISAALDVNIKTVRKQISSGDIPSLKIGSRFRVPAWWMERIRSGPNVVTK